MMVRRLHAGRRGEESKRPLGRRQLIWLESSGKLPGIQALDEQLRLRRVSLTAASKQEPENQFVVISGLARTYHLKTCPAVPKTARHHRFEMMRAFAKQSGHTPCSRCKPG